MLRGNLAKRTAARLSAGAALRVPKHAGAQRMVSSHADPAEDSATGKWIREHEPYTVTTYARNPLVLVRGKGSHVWDLEDRKYIDFTAGIAVTALGHGDEKVAELLSAQARELIHSSNLYHNLWAGALAKSIVDTTLDRRAMQGASKIFFSNSGSEANEGAIKFARRHGRSISPDKTGIVSFNNSFHGRTYGALSATPNPKYQEPFWPMVPDFHVGTYNDSAALETLVTDKTAGVIIEPIQGEGGIFEASRDFILALRERCNQTGAVLIYDEIQCGLGRTGDLWAHEAFSAAAHPDILTMAKPLANGVPIGAVMITQRVAEQIKIGDHGTTFGGNPLACRVGHYVFGRLSSLELLTHVRTISDLFTQRFDKLQAKFPSHIAGSRGRGLLLGLAFKQDPSGLVAACRQRGLLVITAGNNTVRFVPPLTITAQEATEGLDILEEAMAEL